MSDYVIDVEDVWKRYGGGVHALQGVSLQVPRGEVFGFLGPNGAGKSTLVKILTTIVRPTKCKGTMLGEKVGHKNTLRKVGYLPEHASFPDYLKGREVVEYVAGLSGVSRKDAKVKARELLELVGMAEWSEKRMGSYSKGMKQRVGLAQALVNDPELVFLDEPTDGVDPRGRKEMRDLMMDMKSQGRTVFVNSHLLGELELICDSVAIIDQGRLVRQGAITELTRDSRRVEIDVVEVLPVRVLEKLEKSGVEVRGKTLSMNNVGIGEVQFCIDLLRGNQVSIARVQETRESLESLFMSSVSETGVGGNQN